MISCRCAVLQELDGGERQNYVRSHLKIINVDVERWQTLYHCPRTGLYWKEYYPHAERQGGWAPHFVRIVEREAKAEFAI